MAKLDFPAHPTLDQEYNFPPFTYRWDGEKWKTLGRGGSPVADAIREHKEDPKAHDLALIGALPSDGSGHMSGPLEIATTNNEAIRLAYPAGGDGGHIRGRENGALDWYVGRANSGGDVALYSNKHANGVIIRNDYMETVKPFRLGSAGMYFYNQRAGSVDLNTLFTALHCGVYYQDSNGAASIANHYPMAEAGTLLVTGSAYGVQQEYTTFTTNRKFVRGQGQAGGAHWYEWREIGGPKHHLSGYRITSTTIGAGGTALMVPTIFPSNYGIDSAGGSGAFNIHKTATYEISFGYSIEPQTVNQQAIGDILVNDVSLFDVINYNYCPASTTPQMGVSSVSVIAKLNNGDVVKFRIRAVNGTTARLYQSGHVTIKELY